MSSMPGGKRNGFNTLAECQTKAIGMGTIIFAISGGVFFFGQESLKKYLPYKPTAFIGLSFVGAMATGLAYMKLNFNECERLFPKRP